MKKTREQYIEEAYDVMQDVDEVANLLEDRDEAEKVYMQGKSVLAFNIINQLYLYLTDADKAALASYLAKDIDTKQQADVDNLTNLVSAKEDMIAQMAERMNELDDKVSELTEALDASSVFCEGIKEHFIKKACEFLCKKCSEANSGHLKDGESCSFIREFKQAMEGE